MRTAEIIAPAVFTRGLAPSRRQSPQYGFADVARRLGLVEFKTRTIVDHIRQLVASCGFPAPLTSRFRKGQRLVGPAAVSTRSLWDAESVDAWLDRDPSPGAAATREQGAQHQSAARMMGRAQLLVANG